MTTPPRAAGLPTRTIVAYALPALALAVVGVPVFVYLPRLYTDVIGVPVGVVGAILMGARAFDGITDPLMGRISDGLSTRWGRRRPLIALFSLPLAASVLVLYLPPHLSEPWGSAWFGIGVFLTFLFWTAVIVPYEALGPELTPDYDERTVALGTREAFLVVGTMLAVATPAGLDWLLGLDGSPADERRKFGLVGLIYAPAIVASAWWCAASVRERAPSETPPPSGLLTSIAQLLANRPFRVLLSSYTVSALGSTLPAILIPYFVTYYLQSDHLYTFLLSYFVVGMGALPLWMLLARRVGKKVAWLAAMGVNTGAFGFVLALEPGQEIAYGVLVVLSGIGGGAVLALPPAMQADVIDYDELVTGHRREGEFVGLWSVARKLAGAVGSGAALALLGVAGYVPNQAQSQQVLDMLIWLYVGVPVACNVGAILIAARYPIGRHEHEAIRRGIQALNRGETVIDPLGRDELRRPLRA